MSRSTKHTPSLGLRLASESRHPSREGTQAKYSHPELARPRRRLGDQGSPLERGGRAAPGCVRWLNWLVALLCIGEATPAQGQTAREPRTIAPVRSESIRFTGLNEVNRRPAPPAAAPHAIVGVALIDGRGGPVVPDASVIVRGNIIVAAGPRRDIQVPKDAIVFDGAGLSLLPGLIDAHFHISNLPVDVNVIPKLWLSRGVTTVRDPGCGIEHYEPIFKRRDVPRLFLTGRHLDQAPPAYPRHSVLVNSAEETRLTVERFVGQGASAIKIYYRLPPELIRVACDTAHAKGIPVTAHLELIDADQAILAGLDGIEHITSFGTVLAERAAAERFRKGVAADNRFRENGRFQLWSEIDFQDSPAAKKIIELLLVRKIFVSPTLGIFDYRPGDEKSQEFHARGFQNMLKFVGMLHRAGVRVVNGSHTWHRHAPFGSAVQHEMELFVECGMTPLEAITASTTRNAEFLGCADRLGSIEPGKIADLLLVQGDPSRDIKVLSAVRRVMLNGEWIEAEASAAP